MRKIEKYAVSHVPHLNHVLGRDRNPLALAPGVRFPATLSCQAGAVVWLLNPSW